MYLAGLKGEDVQMKLAKEFVIWLECDNGGEEVDREAQKARESGVNSVPTFEINRKRLEGAEDASAFYEAFSEIKETLY